MGNQQPAIGWQRTMPMFPEYFPDRLCIQSELDGQLGGQGSGVDLSFHRQRFGDARGQQRWDRALILQSETGGGIGHLLAHSDTATENRGIES